MALLLTILGFGLFIFATRTVNRWDGGRIPIHVHVMIGIVAVGVLLMGLYLLMAPQVRSVHSAAIGGASERAIMNQTGHGS